VQHVHRFLTQALLWSNRGTGATSMSRLGLTALGVFVAKPTVGPFNPSSGTAIISSFTDPAKLLQREHKRAPRKLCSAGQEARPEAWGAINKRG
jgi:hypothetical protein